MNDRTPSGKTRKHFDGQNFVETTIDIRDTYGRSTNAEIWKSETDLGGGSSRELARR